eukprot:2962267-Ditylum_brightwellii.AAC.1
MKVPLRTASETGKFATQSKYWDNSGIVKGVPYACPKWCLLRTVRSSSLQSAVVVVSAFGQDSGIDIE